ESQIRAAVVLSSDQALPTAKAERSIDCGVRGGRMAESADEGGSRDPALGADGDPRRSPKASTCKGKSCKGCLYYSWRLKSDARIPVGVGIGRMLPQVPNYIIGESEMEATKEGRSLSDFKYTCVGYSVFLDTKNDNAEKPENQAELPFCAGIELLVDRRASTSGHVPANVQKEETRARMLHHSQPRAHRSAHPSGDELGLSPCRFRKNAGLVASGVAKNLNRVGNYIKESVDNILYPHRRRPK
ncbi:unnamed protein product, partial [Musa hybrid cultivar]